MLTWIFWLAIAWLVYAYVGFPVLVVAVGALRRRRVRARAITPPVSMLIPAYNEADVIAEKLANTLALDYPAERLQVIVASDGSSDETAAIAANHRGVDVLALPRQGKVRTLNRAVEHARGDILVFTDANTLCEPGALRALAANFADPDVGGVAGHTSYRVERGAESSGEGERLYWSYDTLLKQLESQTGSIVSAHGGLYAIRRALWTPIADAGVTDDFAISTEVVARGYRLVFEPAARAIECTVKQARHEFGRRVRLMTRGLRGVLLRRDLLNPFRFGFYAVTLFSHKVARRLVPVALAALLLTSLALSATGPFYRSAAVVQLAFYTLAAAGYALRRRPLGRWALLYIPFYYVMANLACGIACLRLLRGHRIEVWQPQRHTP